METVFVLVSPGLQEQDPSTGEHWALFLHLQLDEQFTPYVPSGQVTEQLWPWRGFTVTQPSEAQKEEVVS